ncbi:hypothetical protein SSP2399 [Staphylococcus saprophyticus subsp. saprophyticus ATCC 15305]|uniref:Uncharacterized protein n=1 Tax=Staphylococcus saprophyticus subsp. saprophyticus (strain ATCC 15305 / DSM 20229 / NCIMB 8711 / NCTC 7292 / S-41) TaxID=342451 RepID=Q49UM7_STAS1|nr:hypothetical protein SSP2399 [Staphylococcus saprophyticus subsp. saprophyticus ATCC 15305] [Staphylococcus saprophyticus subsp. saprophyticus ATCC 15305 = NCTC 7292]
MSCSFKRLAQNTLYLYDYTSSDTAFWLYLT